MVGTGLAGGVGRCHPGGAGLRRRQPLHPGLAHAAPIRVAAQGGINAAKNYQNDGDSVWRLFYDTVKGGDFRRGSPTCIAWRSSAAEIIDQCVAQGVPFAREYGGTLANRSFGGRAGLAHLLCPRPDRAAAALGCYGGLMRQVDAGRVTLLPAARDAGSGARWTGRPAASCAAT